jgi:acyl-[acyl-carrier-protein]-phospholipid O-acyltransferase/long-chain-fatty-acid--[acyl-carrier-protein] ligase
VLFALGVQATFFGPLKYAILPEHLHENELIAGNGLIEAGTFIAILLGTIIGGAVILQKNGEYVISAMIMLVALLGWWSSLFIPKTQKPQIALKINYNFMTETKNLLVYSKQNRDIFLCILAISWFWLFGATFLSELPVFAKDVLHADQDVVILFLSIFSIGLGVGSVICNKLLNGKIQVSSVPFGVLGMTIFTIDLYVSASHIIIGSIDSLMGVRDFIRSFNGWRIAIDLLSIAISGGLYTVPLYAMMQNLSSPSHRGRIIASSNVVSALFMVIAAVATAVMIGPGFTVADVFLIMAMCNGLVAIYICKLLPDAIIKGIFKSILTLLYRVKVNGLENYYQAGERVVIVANHTSFLDAILLATFLPDGLTFAINTQTAKEWWIKHCLRSVETYPLNPNNSMAIKSLIKHVENNKRCVIFPEGRITMTGALMKIYEGHGMVADKSGATILPIHIDGAQFTPFSRLKGKVGIKLMPTITITIQPPKLLDIPPEVTGRARREKIGRELYEIMIEMVFRSPNSKKLISSLNRGL